MLIASLLLSAALSVRLSPQHAYIESEEHGQAINFDLIVENRTDQPLDLDEVQLSVYDRAGKLVLRKFIDGNGTRPSIRTADVGEVPPKSTALLFNPFHRFDPGIELASMHFELHFSSKDGKQTFVETLIVNPEKYPAHARLMLPLAKRLIVYDGHDFYAHHRRWDYTIPGIRELGFRTNFMRYSYDFVPVDAAGNMSSGPEEKNESWFGFGRPILAAAEGDVAAVRDDQPDDRNFNPATIATDGPMKIWGNYVVIDNGHGEFSLYGHIRQKSARVKVGQHVRRGEAIAAIGASGSSKFPHLHFELQNGPDTNAEGLPSTFHDFARVRGSRVVRIPAGTVNSGDLLER